MTPISLNPEPWRLELSESKTEYWLKDVNSQVLCVIARKPDPTDPTKDVAGDFHARLFQTAPRLLRKVQQMHDLILERARAMSDLSPEDRAAVAYACGTLMSLILQVRGPQLEDLDAPFPPPGIG